MTETVIRPATQEDLPSLLECEQGIIVAERPFDITLKAGHIHYYDIGKVIRSDDGEVIVAEQEGQVVASGFVELLPAKAHLRHDRYAHICFMFVAPECRGQGLNKMIIDALLAWSKAQGVNEVRLDVYAGNEAAIKAYQKAGFTSHLIEMRKSI